MQKSVKVFIVGGWGAVEKTLAREFPPGSEATEVQPRVWVVRSAHDEVIGGIGKDPWTREGVLGLVQDAE